jgi:hypothetical protein
VKPRPWSRSGKHCVVYFSHTVGRENYVASCHARKIDAVRNAKRLNQGSGIGGFFAVQREGIAPNTGAQVDRQPRVDATPFLP